MLRVGEDVDDQTRLDDFSRVHDRDAIARLREDREVMRDEDHGEPEISSKPFEELEDLSLDHHVERRHGLIRDDEARVAGERHRDHHPLAHSSGELVWIVIDPLARDAAQLEELTGPFHGRRFRRPFVQDDRLGDLSPNPPDRIEGVHRPLKDDRDLLPADLPHRRLGGADEVAPLERDGPTDDPTVRRE